MKKTEVKDGKVINIIEVDAANIPEWCEDWPNAESDTCIGYVWNGTTFAPPAPDVDYESKKARDLRDKYLRDIVDPYVGNFLRWADLHPLKQQEIIEYRKALLDIPQQSGFPLFIEWPTIPVI